MKSRLGGHLGGKMHREDKCSSSVKSLAHTEGHYHRNKLPLVVVGWTNKTPFVFFAANQNKETNRHIYTKMYKGVGMDYYITCY